MFQKSIYDLFSCSIWDQVYMYYANIYGVVIDFDLGFWQETCFG